MNAINYYLGITLFLFSGRVNCQEKEWIKFTKSTDDSWITNVAVDTSDNVIVTAWCRTKRMTIGGISFTGTGEGCMVKFKPDGSILWLKEIPGLAYDIKIGKDNSIYLTGGFSYTGKLDGKLYSSGSMFDDLYVTKLNSEGKMIWFHQSSGDQGERGLHLELDSKENLYMVAEYGHKDKYKTATFCGHDLPPPTHSQKHAFIAKFDRTGKNEFVIPFSSWGDEPSFAIDKEDNLYATLWLARGLIMAFDSTYKKVNLTSRIVKFNSDWKVIGMIDLPDVGVGSVHCDKQNNLLVTGSFRKAIRYFGEDIPNQGGRDFIAMKFSPLGGLIWANYGGGSEGDPYGGDMGLDIETNDSGDVFVCGMIGGPTTFKDTSIFITTGKNFGSGGFILKYNADGELKWIRTTESKVFSMLQNLTVDKGGNVLVSGNYQDSCWIENSLNIAAGDRGDSFIIKYHDLDTSHGANYQHLVCRSVYFERDSYDLSDNEKLLLIHVKYFLLENTNFTINCIGHTDRDGSDDTYQMTLSEARATTVKTYLTGCGIDSTRIFISGVGADKNINSNLTEVERQENRRVEIIVRLEK